MKTPNYYLKSLIVAKDGKMGDAAMALGMRADRLSRIVHRRVNPSAVEMTKIAGYLQRPAGELF